MTALLVAVFLALPELVLRLVQRQAWAARLGTIVMCYAAGLLVGNLGLLPAAAQPAQKLLSEVTVTLALPMLLFTVDQRAWSRIAGRALVSMALAVLSVVVVATALFFAFRAQGQPALHQLAGLAVGVYTGGTPNLAAIKTGLGVDDTRYLVFNAFDTVVGALYLMFMLTLAPRLAARRLRPGPGATPATAGTEPAAMHDEDYRALRTRAGLLGVASSLAVAVLVVASAVGLAGLRAAGCAVAGQPRTAGLGHGLRHHRLRDRHPARDRDRAAAAQLHLIGRTP
jgi:uncharacterized membrane protein